MPFPLAHPAAILPLRRYCPRYLSFVALVVGSIAPDTAYLLDDMNDFSKTGGKLFGFLAQGLENASWDDLSHVFIGSFIYSLPIGLIVLCLFRWLRSSLVATLPNPYWYALRRIGDSPPPRIIVSIISLLVGSWLHIAWDQFTNDERWLASQWAFLHWPVASFGTTHIELCRFLWGLSSLGGMMALVFAYVKFLKRNRFSMPISSQSERQPRLIWTAAILIPVFIAMPLALHFQDQGATGTGLFRLVHRFAGLYIAIFCGGVFVLSLVSKITHWRFRLND